MTNKVFMDALTEEQQNRLSIIVHDHRIWSDDTFGDVSEVGSLKHLAKEALEAAEESNNPLEYADCMFLLWDALARQPHFDVDALLAAMENKMIINRQRSWPAPKEGEPRFHKKEK